MVVLHNSFIDNFAISENANLLLFGRTNKLLFFDKIFIEGYLIFLPLVGLLLPVLFIKLWILDAMVAVIQSFSLDSLFVLQMLRDLLHLLLIGE